MALRPQQRRPSAPPSPVRRSNATTIHFLLLPVTALVGVLAWFLGNALYSSQVDSMARPLLIGLIFVLLYLILAVVVFAFSHATNTFEENIVTGGSGVGGVLAILLGAGLLVFGAAALFQWLYSMNFSAEGMKPTSYVFVIDDSGSMAENDSEQERYAAISTVLDGMGSGFSYMIYSFSDSAEIVKDMAPVSEGIPAITGVSDGQTAIRTVLTQVIDDYKAGVWDGGGAPKVILLTDGYATDLEEYSQLDPVLKRFAAAHISVSTVGLGQVDILLLEQIADVTGGVFVDVSDASGLSEAMSSAAIRYTDRDLLSTRYTANMNVLYGILRVLFLTILCGAIGALMAVAYGFQDSVPLTVGSAVCKGLIGALLLEIGTDMGASDKTLWLVLWILTALTIAAKIISDRRDRRRPAQKPSRNRAPSSRDLSHF